MATYRELLARVKAEVDEIGAVEAREHHGEALFVDVRERDEWEEGIVPGAVHIPRGSLEFKADRSSPTAEKSLAFDKPVILHCASGGRAALAGKLLKDMGYQKVYNLGGFKDWVEAGGKVDK